MTKILFTSTNCSWNKGSAAQVISTASIIRKWNPNVEITLLSTFPKDDFKVCNCHNIKIVSSRVLNKLIIKIVIYLTFSAIIKIGLKRFISKISLIKTYDDSDLIVDLSGDTLSDIGAFSPDVISFLILAQSFKKPLVIYSQSIGPFKNFFIPIARRTIEKVNRVVVRDEITKKYLKNIGVKSHIDLIPDCAFVLEPSNEEIVKKILSKEGINNLKPLIGLSVNGMVGDDNYISVMARVVDHITENLKAHVIFVPHVVARSEDYFDDDRLIGKKIYDQVENKNKVNLINGDYSPNDLKGIIMLCDMFIGGRMHANIAAISSNIPTIATSWSHKYRGIMETVDLADYVCNINNINFEEIKTKIDGLWDIRADVRMNLENNIKSQKEVVWESGKLITNLL